MGGGGHEASKLCHAPGGNTFQIRASREFNRRWTKVHLGDWNGPRDFISPALNILHPEAGPGGLGRNFGKLRPWSLVSDPDWSKKPRNGGNI